MTDKRGLKLIHKKEEEHELELVHEETKELKLELKKEVKTVTQTKPKEILHIKSAKCLRALGKWQLMLHDGSIREVHVAVIQRASFHCHAAHSCGSSYWTGTASGEYDPEDKTKSKQGRKLYFNTDEGGFYDAETKEKITSVSKLQLLPGCEARYWK